MIILGIVLLVVGFVTGISILWVLGAMGHAVAGRRHSW